MTRKTSLGSVGGIQLQSDDMSLISLRRRQRRFGIAAAILLGASALQAQVLAPNLLYTSVQPCRVFDTRSATNGTNGRLIHGRAQTFNVVGGDVTSTTFSGQGGHGGGCALPGFDSFGAPQVQAVVLNFVAVGAAGGGDIVAWPSDQAQPNSSILNYANSGNLGFLNLANGIVMPVRQNSQGADITLKAQTSDTDVLADVVGYFSSGSGDENTALGESALGNNLTGTSNTALGAASLLNNTTGAANTAVGTAALFHLMTGTHNIALGFTAGFGYGGDESSNIVIGNGGATGESNTIRIGMAGNGDGQQNSTFIAGISGKTSAGGTEVFVNSSGQLGTTTSSLRFKQDVEDMADASVDLMQLRPVTFRYKPAYDDGSRLLQYGLIAEEVAKFYPGLVHYDAEGQPVAVRYHFVNAMLLNEVQKLHTRIEQQATRLADQAANIADQKGAIEEGQRRAVAQQSRLEEQTAQIAGQRARMETLEARLATLEAGGSARPHGAVSSERQ